MRFLELHLADLGDFPGCEGGIVHINADDVHYVLPMAKGCQIDGFHVTETAAVVFTMMGMTGEPVNAKPAVAKAAVRRPSF
jgi:hypothetical protein